MNTDSKSTETKQCTINGVMRWLGFSGHKWKYDSIINKHCKKCGVRYKLIDYDGFKETWQEV